MWTSLPDGPFGAIYADPPWAFKTWSAGGVTHRAAETHYRTVAVADLALLPVASVARDDAALFMWIVDSHLVEALALIAAWGFAYKTIAFVWVKTARGVFAPARPSLGYWSRKECEICLLATRGRPRRLDKGVRQVWHEARREHSRKPAEFRRRIERLVDGPRLELFARETHPGWTAWGNEVGKLDHATRDVRAPAQLELVP